MTDRAHDICISQNMRGISVAESPFCYRKLRECSRYKQSQAAGIDFVVDYEVVEC